MLPIEIAENKFDVLKEWETEIAEEKNKLQSARENLKILQTKIKFREKIVAERENRLEEIAAAQAEREEKLRLSEETAEEISKFAALLDTQNEEIQRQKISLKNLQNELVKREQELQTKITEQETLQVEKLQKKLKSIRDQELRSLNVELERMRKDMTREVDRRRQALETETATRLTAVDEELKNRREKFNLTLIQLRSAADEEIKKRRELDNEKNSAFREQQEKFFQEQKNTLQKKEQSLRDLQIQLNVDKKNLEIEKLRLKAVEGKLKNLQVTFDKEIETRLEERKKTFDEKVLSMRQENDLLRSELKYVEDKLASFETLKAVYGENPEIFRQKFVDLQKAYEMLQEDFFQRPGPEVVQQYENLKIEHSKLKNSVQNQLEQLGILQQQVGEVEQLRIKNTILQEANDNLQVQWTEAQDVIRNYENQIKRLTATTATAADWNKRAESLRETYLTSPFNAPKISQDQVNEFDEMIWLDKLEDACKSYGITFPRRILYAFHTSFKIANWSTLTVLAGVSGTGKSELPRLYSAFGGFNFINVPVQPNWDSQESMLGFFNSIDNKFDAQPVLRFLVECTEKYDNNMAVILLDEMNLAHVEHYFADFLSKLEMRRSASENQVPEIYVNLGAGVKPYGLPLKRNILWCGTMNQDETTKSLSDKVLDRGIVINFPRPKILKDRLDAKDLETFCNELDIKPMSKQLWNSWVVDFVSLKDEQLQKLNEYRHLLEEMNDNLSYVGRAIGHRVWQSIEYYVVNYPTVRAAISKSKGELTKDLLQAMHIAVEDQIVQKVMPKLRGIDTRGKSYEKCLAPIKGQLNDAGFNLDEDFDRACEMGYGQFMWGSAEYIEKENF